MAKCVNAPLPPLPTAPPSPLPPLSTPSLSYSNVQTCTTQSLPHFSCQGKGFSLQGDFCDDSHVSKKPPHLIFPKVS